MKLLIVFLLLSTHAFSQIEVRGSIGVSNRAGIVNGSIGVASDNERHHLYLNQIVHLTNAYNVPDILGVRYAESILRFEPSVGIDYHLLSPRVENDAHRGWQFAYGLAYKLEKVFLQFGFSGHVYYGTIGIYKIL